MNAGRQHLYEKKMTAYAEKGEATRGQCGFFTHCRITTARGVVMVNGAATAATGTEATPFPT